MEPRLALLVMFTTEVFDYDPRVLGKAKKGRG